MFIEHKFRKDRWWTEISSTNWGFLLFVLFSLFFFFETITKCNFMVGAPR